MKPENNRTEPTGSFTNSKGDETKTNHPQEQSPSQGQTLSQGQLPPSRANPFLKHKPA